MLPIISRVNLLRYLIVWRVNGSLVQLPRCLSAEISRVLGTALAERLPTAQARPWRKAMEGWGSATASDESETVKTSGAGKSRATNDWPAWPLEAVLWPYPGKRVYGQGEPILWELKLLGDDADHGVFLETILPVMEAVSATADERWRRARTLWGRFDIQAIYVSRGSSWEPVVRDGRLDLDVRPNSTQWLEGMTFGSEAKHRPQRLMWLTPFDLDPAGAAARTSQPSPPTLRDILDALMVRLAPLVLGKRATAAQMWESLPPEEQAALHRACDETQLKISGLEAAPKDGPGRWIGGQTFTKIPPRVLSYLELAAILHLGQATHLGCGTFALT